MTILNTIEGGPSIILSILGMLAICGFIMFLPVAIIFSSSKRWYVASIAITLATIAFMSVIGIIEYPEKCRTRVECTISDDVSFNDIYEKYEIKDKRGDIYTLIVRNEEE